MKGLTKEFRINNPVHSVGMKTPILDNHNGSQQAIKVVVIMNSKNILLRFFVCFAIFFFVAVTGADFVELLRTFA